MSEKPAATPPANAGSQISPATQAAVELDAHELGERLRALRGRVDELRGRL